MFTYRATLNELTVTSGAGASSQGRTSLVVKENRRAQAAIKNDYVGKDKMTRGPEPAHEAEPLKSLKQKVAAGHPHK